jgi:hypothetical protein
MTPQVFFTLLICILWYVCFTDPNILDWVTIKIQHFFVYLHLQYIKLKWKFKKF